GGGGRKRTECRGSERHPFAEKEGIAGAIGDVGEAHVWADHERMSRVDAHESIRGTDVDRSLQDALVIIGPRVIRLASTDTSIADTATSITLARELYQRPARIAGTVEDGNRRQKIRHQRRCAQ